MALRVITFDIAGPTHGSLCQQISHDPLIMPQPKQGSCDANSIRGMQSALQPHGHKVQMPLSQEFWYSAGG